MPSDPDPHCAKEFCESDFGKPHCDAGRVRVLRMQEYEVALPSLCVSFGLSMCSDSVADQLGVAGVGPFLCSVSGFENLERAELHSSDRCSYAVP